METGSRTLTERYSKQDLDIVELIRCTLEEENMTDVPDKAGTLL